MDNIYIKVKIGDDEYTIRQELDYFESVMLSEGMEEGKMGFLKYLTSDMINEWSKDQPEQSEEWKVRVCKERLEYINKYKKDHPGSQFSDEARLKKVIEGYEGRND